jgi:hypothetical protein
MTEAEWLACGDPAPMLEFVRHNASDRKCRLVACACCRALDHIVDDRQRQAVEAAEQFADGKMGSREFWRASDGFSNKHHQFFDAVSDGDRHPAPSVVSDCLVSCACVHEPRDQGEPWDGACDATFTAGYVSPPDLRSVRGHLIRDIFGNPFRPVAFDPRWRTADALGLARAVYEDRAFDRLPLLADALMDAGCAGEQILDHCRGPGPHVRGCWVVDLVLGKE